MVSHFQDNEKAGKPALRRKMLALREEHGATDAAAIALLSCPLWAKADVVALYAALPLEAATIPLMENAWRNGKRICLPKIANQRKHEMNFFFCEHTNELINGPFGLQEPNGRQFCSQVDLMILPGLAFDFAGNRLGYGGGYYDRFLGSNKNFAKFKIGICHDYQVVAHIPHDSYDMTVQGICTESGLRWL